MEIKTVKLEVSFDVAIKGEDVSASSSNEELAKWFEDWLCQEYKRMDNIDNVVVKADIADKV